MSVEKVRAAAALAALVGGGLAATLLVDIRGDEGRVLHSYRDIAGIVTACDGITGPGIRMGQTYTHAQCDEMTAAALLRHAAVVIRCVPALIEVGREQQLRAATRFDYNTGLFCQGSVARHMKAGRWRQGCDAMLLYNKARVRGVLRVVRGLVLRRERERAVCLQGLIQARG